MKVDGMGLRGMLGFSRGLDYGLMESGLMGYHKYQDVGTMLYSTVTNITVVVIHGIA